MTISPTSSGFGAPSAPVSRDAASAISADFDTFLKMLTAQISNQDPLNPMNSEQFAVQLATFSGVEQQVRTNQLLEAMIGGQGQSDFSQMGSWVGMEARAAMPARFEGTPLTVTPPQPIAGTRHEMAVYDAAGAEIWRGRYTPGTGSVVWDGIRPDGTAVATGNYTFRLESFENDDLVSTAPVQTYGRVQEVRLEGGRPVLVFDSGAVLGVSDVTGLRGGGPAVP